MGGITPSLPYAGVYIVGRGIGTVGQGKSALTNSDFYRDIETWDPLGEKGTI